MKKQCDILHEPQLSSLQKYVDDKDSLLEMDLAKKVFVFHEVYDLSIFEKIGPK